jgi:hypothetical protein
VALGGTSYAAFNLPKNSVGTTQLKNNAVTNKKIANGAVSGSKVNLSTLGTVPNAGHAASADTANSANTAGNASNLGGQPASAYAHSTPLSPTPVTFQNGWTNSNGAGNVGFAKDQFGIVHLFGAAANSSSTQLTIFTLPVGDRPAYTVYEEVTIAGAPPARGIIEIGTDGMVFTFGFFTTFVDLEGVTFLAGG